jgi:hypothetical protein
MLVPGRSTCHNVPRHAPKPASAAPQRRVIRKIFVYFSLGPMSAPFVLAVIFGGLFGIWLTFWHRSLMIQLHACAPEVWQRLGSSYISRDLWSWSLRYPVWSWRSMFFFATGRYKRLGNSHFSALASRFRIAFLAWIAFLLGTTAFAFWMDAYKRPNQAIELTATRRTPLFCITSTHSPAAMLADGRSSSSCSR